MRAAVIGSIQEARKLGNIVGPVQDTLDSGNPVNKDDRAVPMMSQMMKNGSAPMGQTPVPAQAMKATLSFPVWWNWIQNWKSRRPNLTRFT